MPVGRTHLQPYTQPTPTPKCTLGHAQMHARPRPCQRPRQRPRPRLAYVPARHARAARRPARSSRASAACPAYVLASCTPGMELLARVRVRTLSPLLAQKRLERPRPKAARSSLASPTCSLHGPTPAPTHVLYFIFPFGFAHPS
eukprot:793682-Pleurochrysis_carterae.AAC.4